MYDLVEENKQQRPPGSKEPKKITRLRTRMITFKQAKKRFEELRRRQLLGDSTITEADVSEAARKFHAVYNEVHGMALTLNRGQGSEEYEDIG